MTAALDALRDDLAQLACDHDQHTAGLPPVCLTNHPFALADYRARVQPLMGRIAVELARVAVEHSPHGRVDPLFSWDPNARPLCAPLPFTGKACASREPLPHHCYSATDYVSDAHDRSEGNQS